VENDGNLQWTASAQWEALSWEGTHQTHQQALMKLHCRRELAGMSELETLHARRAAGRGGQGLV